VEDLDGEEARDLGIHQIVVFELGMAAHARQQRREAVESQPPQERRKPEPERAHVASQEEAIVTESLIERHEDAAALLGAQLAALVVGQELAFGNTLEIDEAGQHPKIVLRPDGVAITDLDEAG
jgi:hypothetical protein